MSPTRPYTTWAPACSSLRAQVMLVSSSKRALISTRTTTCLPRSAARISARTIGESPDVRYRVCLIVRTSGSSAAWLDEPLDRRRERLVRVVDEDVGAADLREDVDGSSSSTGRGAADDGRVVGRLEVRPVEGDQLPQRREVEHPGDLEAVLLADAGAADQDAPGHVGHRALDLEPDRLAEPAAPDLLLDRLSRSSASSSSIAMSASRVTRKRCVSRISMPRNSSSRLASITWSRRTNLSRSTSNRRGEQGRDLDPGEALLAGLGVAQPDGDRQAERRDVRERVPGVDGERREHREDLVVEPPPEGLVVLRDLVVVHDLDALGGAAPRGSVQTAEWSLIARGRARGSRRAAPPGVRPSLLVCTPVDWPGGGGRRRGPGRTRPGSTRRWPGT